jgi:hypothetical protein
VYKGRKYSVRTVAETLADIQAVQRTRQLILSELSELTGQPPQPEALFHIVTKYPSIYGRPPTQLSPQQGDALQTLHNVYRWMKHGAERVFLQDANAPATKTHGLIEVLQTLKETFPSVETVTAYARSKTCHRKSRGELEMLKDAGVTWCFVGIESGCDDVLRYMKKGVTAKEHLGAGEKLMASGIQTAAFVMPGLGGSDPALRTRHVSDTIRVLNKIEPTEVRIRSLAVLESAPLFQDWKSGIFQAADDDQMIEEIRSIMEGLRFDCTFETLQMTNPLFTVKGPLSQVRDTLLDGMDWYRTLPPLEKARLLFSRYVNEGYLEFVKAWGKYDSQLEVLIRDAESGLAARREDAVALVHRAIFLLKSKGVP